MQNALRSGISAVKTRQAPRRLLTLSNTVFRGSPRTLVLIRASLSSPVAPCAAVQSETAFVIFVVMATRRLEADPLFTKDFNAEVASFYFFVEALLGQHFRAYR